MLKDLPLDKKKVLVRVDFNVPQDEKGNILDNSRIVAALPSIQYLLSKQCKIILMSHLGRPDGAYSEKYSLKPISLELAKLLGREVKLAKDVVGPEVENQVACLKEGEVLLLENLRFYPAEEKPEKDPHFAEQLAAFADFYVDDAFGALHRNHASVVSVPKLLKGKTAAGFLLEKEIAFLGKALKDPARPFLALIGGAKVSTKIGVLKALSSKVDILAIGGGMAYTFLKAQGFEVGNSLVEEAFIEEAKRILEVFKKEGRTLLLPIDVVISDHIADDAKTQICLIKEGIPKGFSGFDIGPKTIEEFNRAIGLAKTIFWNGPMGVFEKKPFSQGTSSVAKSFATSSAITVAGGGETISAIEKTPWKDKVSHLSTGGGAALEYLELGTLPGLEALQ